MKIFIEKLFPFIKQSLDRTVFIFRSKVSYKKYAVSAIILFLSLNLTSLSFAVSLNSQSSNLKQSDLKQGDQTDKPQESANSQPSNLKQSDLKQGDQTDKPQESSNSQSSNLKQSDLKQGDQTEKSQKSADSLKLSQSIQKGSKLNKHQKIAKITSNSMETAKKPMESLPDLEELNSIENLRTTDIASTDLSKIDFFWKASFQIQNFNDETTTNGVISTKIYGDLRWDLTEQFSFQSQALFIGRNGFTQSIYDREDRSRGLYLLESFFEWKFRDSFFSFKFGNIEQSFLQAPLLMTDRTFPSFILNYSLEEFYNFKPSFFIQSSIPDNAEESVRRETQIIRGFPSFSVLSFYLENSKLPLLLEHYFSNRLMFFHYYNLSQAVAQRSRIYENTVDRAQSDSVFRYDYYGFHNHSNFKMVLSHFLAGEVGLEYMNNLGASKYNNEGYRVYTSFSYNYKDFLEWKAVFEKFLNQSDSSVAYYNSEFYGHNSRKGFALRLECYFYDSGMRVGASFVNTKPIDTNDRTAIGPSNAISIFLTTNQIKI